MYFIRCSRVFIKVGSYEAGQAITDDLDLKIGVEETSYHETSFGVTQSLIRLENGYPLHQLLVSIPSASSSSGVAGLATVPSGNWHHPGSS